MKLNELNKVVTRSNKRVGRGLGSGKGKTSGRGTKGQKARGKIPIGFTSGLSLYKKLPLRRGKGNPQVTSKLQPINLSQLNTFKAKAVVDLDGLLKERVISKKEAKSGVKILGKGEIDKALIIKLPISAGARKKIEAKGGKVEYV